MTLYCFSVAYTPRGWHRCEHEARQALAHTEEEASEKVLQQVLSYRGSPPEEINPLGRSSDRTVAERP